MCRAYGICMLFRYVFFLGLKLGKLVDYLLATSFSICKVLLISRSLDSCLLEGCDLLLIKGNSNKYIKSKKSKKSVGLGTRGSLSGLTNLEDTVVNKIITINLNNRILNKYNLRGIIRDPSMVIIKVGNSIKSRRKTLEMLTIRRKVDDLIDGNKSEIVETNYWGWFLSLLTFLILTISGLFYLSNKLDNDVNDVVDSNVDNACIPHLDLVDSDIDTVSGISCIDNDKTELDLVTVNIDTDDYTKINNLEKSLDDNTNNVGKSKDDESIVKDDEVTEMFDESIVKGDEVTEMSDDDLGNVEIPVCIGVDDLGNVETPVGIVDDSKPLELTGKDTNSDFLNKNLLNLLDTSNRLLYYEGKYMLLTGSLSDVDWLKDLKILSLNTIEEEVSGKKRVSLTIDTNVARGLFNNVNEEPSSKTGVVDLGIDELPDTGKSSVYEVPGTGKASVYQDNQLRVIIDSLLTSGEVTIISPVLSTDTSSKTSPVSINEPSDSPGVFLSTLEYPINNLDNLKSLEIKEKYDPDSLLEGSKTIKQPIPLDLWWKTTERPTDLESIKIWERDLAVKKYWLDRLEPSDSNWVELQISLANNTTNVDNNNNNNDIEDDNKGLLDDHYKKGSSNGVGNLDHLNEGDLANLFKNNDNKSVEKLNKGVGDLNNLDEGDLERLFIKGDIKQSKAPGFTDLIEYVGGLSIIKDLVTKLNKERSDSLDKESNGSITGVDYEETVKAIINNTTLILDEVKSITSKGYVNSYNLMDSSLYPNLSSIIHFLIGKDRKGKRYKTLTSKDKIVLSKWGYQVLLFQLYTCLVNIPKNDERNPDIIQDLECLSREIYNVLDSSIKTKLQNKGISLIQNTYTGFDTEFQYKESEKCNKLLSIQLAVNSKCLLKFPHYTEYTVGSLNPLNNDYYELGKGNRLDRVLVDNIINELIHKSRSVEVEGMIKSLNILIEGLIAMKIPYYKNDKEYVFSFGEERRKSMKDLR